MNEPNVTFKDKYASCKTWQERAVLISLYHMTMCYKYPAWTITDTSEYFDVSIGLVSENVRLGKEIDSGNRKVINAKTREDGLRLVERRRYVRDRRDFTIHKLMGNEDDDD